ncbi:MAG: pyridoxine 5'-phosphate synthase [Deltaproteobacteria bacterium]|nr:pyridoxine 5'-phosphate synthase [Deltaproteobacteria bacterium]HDH86457.1 pyridoxine 5'-phosphate synthase [Desulfobacteraceae bacterium]MBW2104665.1 pyridoxine 5'-phosphate synthase [Deltaproteobacteria bacterium]MBW2332605.1 pyridoxine 5'-phosphate synthase [Deltaproteobacteria bacterium]RLB17995.1 MAG: pyridoxine 5'-phosphate synthase [Deltaproteobacteria bacterium]
MALLSINVDHIATIREARGINEPDPVLAAGIAELAGAEGIICHLREDRRHIKNRDLELLKKTVKTKLNLEMSPVKTLIDTALTIKPDLVTLVPERREEVTTESGLDVAGNKKEYTSVTGTLKEAGISVSFFIDPDPDQIQESLDAGADIIEIHTGFYSEAVSEAEILREFEKIHEAAKLGSQLKLKVHAGHGLNYVNIKRFSSIPEIEEYSIGHSIIARAVMVGLDQAIREMINLVSQF